jgi:similar to stage IV sporulation protein
MFFVRIIQYIFGYVRFRAENGSIERFINFCTKADIKLWGIRKKSGVLFANTRAKSYKKIRYPAHKSHVRIHIIKRHGVPFIFNKYEARSGLIAGVVLFLGIIIFLSCFVWTINISGNKEISTQEITQTLSDYGLNQGTFRLTLNIHQIEQEVMMKLPDLAWISINLKGSVANVAIKERMYPPELVAYDKPCNVKASQTGQIIKLEPFEGKAMIKQGDTVKQGDIIVSGIIKEKSGVLRIVHARAKVIARTARTLQVTENFKQKIQKETGKKTDHYELDIFGLTIPLYWGGEPKGSYTKSVDQNNLNVLGAELPFGIKTYEYKEYKTEKIILSEQDAIKNAQDTLSGMEKKEFSDMKVLDKSFENQKSENGITVIGHYNCEENIAYEEEIQISDINK